MQRDIKHNFFLPNPPEAVWEFLTKPELIKQWLMENDFKPVVGHRFQFKTKPIIKFGFDGTVYCEVLEVEPLKRLSYSWKGGMGKDKVHLDSVVIWTLTPRDNGTELRLEHKGFKGLKNFLAYFIMNKGWARIGKRMASLLNTHKNEAASL